MLQILTNVRGIAKAKPETDEALKLLQHAMVRA